MITDQENTTSEKIYVPSHRVTMIAFAFSLIGVVLILLGTISVPFWDIFSTIASIISVVAGCFLIDQGVQFIIKRNTFLQLEFTAEGIYYKPIKWYSYGRGGILTARSVYFSREWCFSAYNDLGTVVLHESDWIGNSIYIVPKIGKSIKLLFVIDDNAEIVRLYKKIKSNIPIDEIYSDLEVMGKVKSGR